MSRPTHDGRPVAPGGRTPGTRLSRASRRTAAVALLLVAASAAAAGAAARSPAGRAAMVSAAPAPPARARLLTLAAEVRAADYAADRAELAALAGRLPAQVRDPALAPFVAYWTGFAWWRRALNGMNVGVAREELDRDLTAAIEAFGRAQVHADLEADAKSAAAACWMSRYSLAMGSGADVTEYLRAYLPLLRDAIARAPANPRVTFVRGGQTFYTPVDRGGGQEKGIELQRQGLADAAREAADAPPERESLAPRWGRAELLMSLAFFESAKAAPDLGAAEAYARAALALQPDWHYVRGILLPSILERRMADAAPHEAFWRRLGALCGQAYAGRVIEAPAGDTTFAGKALVMRVSACEERQVRIPFHVGTDSSRTWVLTRTDVGLRLKHDHRHADGSPDSITQYGGDARLPGEAGRIEFPADAFTAQLIPRATTNVWTVEIEPGWRFVYALRREGTDRRFRLEFDLTRPVPEQEAPPGARGPRPSR